jgi:hypothetical protein
MSLVLALSTPAVAHQFGGDPKQADTPATFLIGQK